MDTIKTIPSLKTIWVSGYKPTQSDFSDLFTTLVANTNTSSSVSITSATGVVNINGNKVITDNLTSSLSVTTASYTLTASYATSLTLQSPSGYVYQIFIDDSGSLNQTRIS